MSIDISGEDKAILYVNLHKFGGEDINDDVEASIDVSYNIPLMKEARKWIVNLERWSLPLHTIPYQNQQGAPIPNNVFETGHAVSVHRYVGNCSAGYVGNAVVVSIRKTAARQLYSSFYRTGLIQQVFTFEKYDDDANNIHSEELTLYTNFVAGATDIDVGGAGAIDVVIPVVANVTTIPATVDPNAPHDLFQSTYYTTPEVYSVHSFLKETGADADGKGITDYNVFLSEDGRAIISYEKLFRNGKGNILLRNGNVAPLTTAADTVRDLPLIETTNELSRAIDFNSTSKRYNAFATGDVASGDAPVPESRNTGFHVLAGNAIQVSAAIQTVPFAAINPLLWDLIGIGGRFVFTATAGTNPIALPPALDAVAFTLIRVEANVATISPRLPVIAVVGLQIEILPPADDGSFMKFSKRLQRIYDIYAVIGPKVGGTDAAPEKSQSNGRVRGGTPIFDRVDQLYALDFEVIGIRMINEVTGENTKLNLIGNYLIEHHFVHNFQRGFNTIPTNERDSFWQEDGRTTIDYNSHEKRYCFIDSANPVHRLKVTAVARYKNVNGKNPNRRVIQLAPNSAMTVKLSFTRR